MTRGCLLCLGYGYTARTLSRALTADGWRIVGTSRSAAGVARISADGHDAVVFDGTEPLPADVLADATHILVSTPPGPDGDPVLLACRSQIASSHGVAWIGYLSTTSVYGDRGGEWVDETSELLPVGARGRRRVTAEQGWLESMADNRPPVHIFRLAGIYGPYRNALVNLLDGTAQRIVKPGQVFSRIHVDDAATVLLASIARPRAGSIYNVCDDEPVPPQDVVAFAAKLMGVELSAEVPFAKAELSPMARSFYEECKRVRNDKIKDELGVQLRYPSYKEGISALWAAMDGSTG